MDEHHKMELLCDTVSDFWKRVIREYWECEKIHTYEEIIARLKKETYGTLMTKSTSRQNNVDPHSATLAARNIYSYIF